MDSSKFYHANVAPNKKNIFFLFELSLHDIRAKKPWGLATQRREGADLLMKKRLNCPLLPQVTPTYGALPVTLGSREHTRKT